VIRLEVYGESEEMATVRAASSTETTSVRSIGELRELKLVGRFLEALSH
jgi:hypothetical protein